MRPVIFALLFCPAVWSATLDGPIQEYFEHQVEHLADQCLTGIHSLEDWKTERERRRQELFEMLSLDPLPEKSDLRAQVTGKVEGEDFIVEKLHFQSLPGLYVTGNLYLPKEVDGPLPAVLYVCGHGGVKTNGISYGNKVTYQHHGAWFARNGYAALLIDTIQLGEIEGIHHGTYREGMWWWNSRGYTPAGVEAWNCIRALDYLETRPEIDKNRFGVTGRSGGGAYSWWVTALDDRIKVSAPVAGITDLHDHVVDGVVEGHCDCMFFVNTYRWDYPMLAALAAPRPLMIANTDRDSIFPLDGVQRVHAKVAKVYDLYDKPANLALVITPGPHKDTQDLQIPVFRWFNQHLKGEDPLIDMAATKFFSPQELKVFEQLPQDERTSRIHDTFVPAAGDEVSNDARTLNRLRADLRRKVFGGWPDAVPAFNVRQVNENGSMKKIRFTSQTGVELNLRISPRDNADAVELRVAPPDGRQSRPDTSKHVIVELIPRNPGEEMNEKQRVQLRRRYMLIGQTLDGMRVWDIRRAIELLGQLPETAGLPIIASADGDAAVNLLYAAIMQPGITELKLSGIPESHSRGPDYLNVLRFMDIPQAIAIAEETMKVTQR